MKLLILLIILSRRLGAFSGKNFDQTSPLNAFAFSLYLMYGAVLDCESQTDIGKIQLFVPRQSNYDGAIVMCTNMYAWTSSEEQEVFTWSFFSSNNEWNSQTSSVACRELGPSFSGEATVDTTNRPILAAFVCMQVAQQIVSTCQGQLSPLLLIHYIAIVMKAS